LARTRAKSENFQNLKNFKIFHFFKKIESPAIGIEWCRVQKAVGRPQRQTGSKIHGRAAPREPRGDLARAAAQLAKLPETASA
jgi:hypothetical protein